MIDMLERLFIGFLVMAAFGGIVLILTFLSLHLFNNYYGFTVSIIIGALYMFVCYGLGSLIKPN